MSRGGCSAAAFIDDVERGRCDGGLGRFRGLCHEQITRCFIGAGSGFGGIFTGYSRVGGARGHGHGGGLRRRFARGHLAVEEQPGNGGEGERRNDDKSQSPRTA